MKFKKVRSMLLAAVLTCSLSIVPVYAAPEDNTSTQSASLESQKAAAQSEADNLQAQLNTLFTKMNELESQLISKGQEIIQAQQDLEAAEEKREQQYEDMKLRIKYMYEEGDNSAIERVLSSGSIAEVLSQAEYVQKVHTYDRDMLQEYADTVTEIEELKTTLEEEQANLQGIQTEYETQSSELSTTLESKRAEVENLDAMIQEAARAALEAQKKAEEEAAAKAAAAAAQQQTVGNAATTNQAAADQTTGGQAVETPAAPAVTQEETTVPEAPAASNPEPSYSAVTGNAIVDRAYSWVGNAEYVWGACSPGAFDCSGFVSYCLTGSYSRLGTTYTFLTWPQVSDPQPGDVCVNEGHCGIYIGGGQMIHAATYGVGVIVGPVQGGMIYVRY